MIELTNKQKKKLVKRGFECTNSEKEVWIKPYPTGCNLPYDDGDSQIELLINPMCCDEDVVVYVCNNYDNPRQEILVDLNEVIKDYVFLLGIKVL